MADEPVMIEGIVGPYAGRRLTVSAADAKQAIADGWARDPFAPVDPDAKPPEFDQEVHDKMLVAAEKAARKLRGEDESESGKKAKETKSLEADKPAAGYETRSASSDPKKK